jgi:heat shock protein HtpX
MNALKTTFLLGAMTGLLLAMGELLGGRDGLTLALLLAGVMNFGAWFWSDKIVLRMYNAQPVGPSEAPELYAIVQGLAQKAGVPMPSCTSSPIRRSTPSPPAAARRTPPSRPRSGS